MKKAESGIVSLMLRMLKARGHCVWKNHGSIYSRRGLSDIAGFRYGDGVGILLEAKTEKSIGNLSEQQKAFLDNAWTTSPRIVRGSPVNVASAKFMVEDVLWKSQFGAERDEKMLRGDFRSLITGKSACGECGAMVNESVCAYCGATGDALSRDFYLRGIDLT